tara:strand:- start:144 stop:1550 length:1407 start_codon:yes stop_codon:yes gene_type:complete
MSKGIVTTMVMVFGSLMILFLSGLVGFILIQHRASVQKISYQEALQAAEAGIEYYKWHLDHFPQDFQDGTGVPGPYVHDYDDATGVVEGTFSLDITGITQCGNTLGATISSTGWTDRFPGVQRTVRVAYVQPAVSDFAAIINEAVWAGSEKEIKGPFHSNGGIRMDAENKSTVTSAKEDWLCTSSFGCDPSTIEDGVFTTANGEEELFIFPVTPFDFDGITQDLVAIKNVAEPQPGGLGLGLYFPPSSTGKGYHVVFDDTNIDVYEIDDLDTVLAYTNELGWFWEDTVIDTESFLGTYAIPSGCGAIFFEDNVWLEGIVQGKVTLVAADLLSPSVDRSIWLEGNIEYTTKDGSDGLVLISQDDISIVLDSPDSMEISGIFIAQGGRYGRNYYNCAWYPADCTKTYLELFGSVVSNERTGTKWSYTWGGIASGYKDRERIFDSNQTSNPPPFLPNIVSEFHTQDWEELE